MDDQGKKELDNILMKGETFVTIFLSRTQAVEDIDDLEVKNFLDRMYASRDPAFARLASVLNSIIAQDQPVFMLSARECNKLIAGDDNSRYNAVDGKVYRAIVAKMLTGTEMFVKLRAPVGAKAAVFELVSPAILSYLHKFHTKEWYGNKKRLILNAFDNKHEKANKIDKDNLPPRPKYSDYLKKMESKEEVTEENFGDKLIESAEQALAHAKGEIELRTTTVKSNPKKKNLWD